MLATLNLGVAIRPARSDDIAALLELQREAFGDDPHCPDRAGLEAAIENPRIDIFVGETGGALAGYVLLKNRRFRPWTAMDYIAVPASLRGSGVGAVLLSEAVARTTRKTIRLFVRESNEVAIAFYKRNGFEKAGIRKANYHDGEDAVILSRQVR
jgi:[ribosomal protein S18]-alanine N-acetyltransferase